MAIEIRTRRAWERHTKKHLKPLSRQFRAENFAGSFTQEPAALTPLKASSRDATPLISEVSSNLKFDQQGVPPLTSELLRTHSIGEHVVC